MNTNLHDEASSPAPELRAREPDQLTEMTDGRKRLLGAMSKLMWLRQGHDGPDVGTRYNVPSQGG